MSQFWQYARINAVIISSPSKAHSQVQYAGSVGEKSPNFTVMANGSSCDICPF